MAASYQTESAALGAASRAIINSGDIYIQKYRDVVISDDDVKVMETIFRKRHSDVTVAVAQADSQILSDLQQKLFTEYPVGKESIAVVTNREVMFGELMTKTASLSAKVAKHYFSNTQSFERKGYQNVSQETKRIFLRQYKDAQTDEERKLLLMNNISRSGIEEYQNWRTQYIADVLTLPKGVEHKKGGGANAVTVDPNTQLFTFPLMVAYLRKKYSEVQLRKMMIFFNQTGPARRRMEGNRPIEFDWRVAGSNPLLIPLCGLTTAKIAGAINLAVGGACFTLAGLAFVGPNQEESVMTVMSKLLTLCSGDISNENAGFYQTVSSTVYRYLEPRGYHMNESRVRGTKYRLNLDADWYYHVDARTLVKSNGESVKKKNEVQVSSMQQLLSSVTKTTAAAASTTSNM